MFHTDTPLEFMALPITVTVRAVFICFRDRFELPTVGTRFFSLLLGLRVLYFACVSHGNNHSSGYSQCKLWLYPFIAGGPE